MKDSDAIVQRALKALRAVVATPSPPTALNGPGRCLHCGNRGRCACLECGQLTWQPGPCRTCLARRERAARVQ